MGSFIAVSSAPVTPLTSFASQNGSLGCFEARLPSYFATRVVQSRRSRKSRYRSGRVSVSCEPFPVEREVRDPELDRVQCPPAEAARGRHVQPQ
jgi:hypothetical protein